jgi:hypothetical protein
MRKRLLFMITALMLVGVMVVPTIASAGDRIQDTGEGTVTLDKADGTDTPQQATGTAKFDLNASEGGWYKMKMKLDVENLPKRAGKVYEVWLTDTETGDSNGEDINQPIGAFQTDNKGDASISVTKPIVFFAPYNQINVSSEDRNDEDPGLNGPIVLRGEMG